MCHTQIQGRMSFLLWRDVFKRFLPGGHLASCSHSRTPRLKIADWRLDWRLLLLWAAAPIQSGARWLLSVTDQITFGCKIETDRYSVGTCVYSISERLVLPVLPTWAACTNASLSSCLPKSILQLLCLHSWNIRHCQESICDNCASHITKIWQNFCLTWVQSMTVNSRWIQNLKLSFKISFSTLVRLRIRWVHPLK